MSKLEVVTHLGLAESLFFRVVHNALDFFAGQTDVSSPICPLMLHIITEMVLCFHAVGADSQHADALYPHPFPYADSAFCSFPAHMRKGSPYRAFPGIPL